MTTGIISAPPHQTIAPIDWAVRPELSLVVPIFNEQENIALLHERVSTILTLIGRSYEIQQFAVRLSVVPALTPNPLSQLGRGGVAAATGVRVSRHSIDAQVAIIAVDDGSSDRSFAILRELAEYNSHLRVVRLRRNFGQTAAFAAGFARARGDVVITIDADLQNDPADIPRLLQELDAGQDVVSGWRKHRQDAFWSRTFPSRIANRLISWATGVSLHDYGCSLKVYRREVLQNIQLYGELHRFIPAIASWQGVSVAELPVHHMPRHAGKSKYGLGRTLRVLLDLLTVRFLLSYSTRPMQIFGLFGLLSIAFGGLIALYLATLKVLTGAALANRPLLLLGVLLIILGMQFMSIGLIGELVIRVHYESQSRLTYVVREELNYADDF